MTETVLNADIPARPAGSELTFRAVLAAVIVAVIMGASYPYMVLKLGFGPNVSVVAAFFGFIILNIIGRSTYDRWQNNIVQTAGTSAAQTAFMCGALGAFDMLRESKIVHFTLNPTSWQIFIWLSIASLLGVLLAVPLRRHFVIDQNLPYPDGIAAGETLIVLDPPRHLGKDDAGWRHAQQAAKVLGIALLASAIVMLFREDALLFNIIPGGWDTGGLVLGVAGAGFLVARMGVGVGYSLLSLGTGLLVSFRVNLSMIIGGVIGWIASMIMRTDAQQGIFLNIIVGIVGAFIGGLIFSGGSINNAGLNLYSFLVSLLGAVVLLAIVNLFRRGSVR